MKVTIQSLLLVLAAGVFAPDSHAFNWNFNLPTFDNPETESDKEPDANPKTITPAPVSTPIYAPAPTQSSDTRRVTGAATKGPIAGAAIKVFAVDARGLPATDANGNDLPPVAETTTDDSGRFTVSVPDTDSVYLVSSSGGSFIDESDQRPLSQRRRISLNSSQGFFSAIMPGQTEVALTPYTDLVIEKARSGSRLSDASSSDSQNFSTIVERLIDASTEGFGFSVFATIPANPVAPAADASDAQKQYALLLGAVANIANTSAIQMGMATPTYGLIRDIISDFSDGSTDGFLNGERIINADSGMPLAIVDFDQQLVRFRNNNYRHYVGVALPEWNGADGILAVQFPRLMYVVEDMNVEVQFSVDRIEALGKVEYSGNGTGTFTDDEGPGNFVWDSFGESLRIDFSGIGGKPDAGREFSEPDANGDIDVIRIAELTDRIEITLVNTSSEPRVAKIRRVGRETRENLTAGGVTTSNFDEELTVSLYDAASLAAFPSPTTFDFIPALPVRLGEGDASGISPSAFEFNDDGTGRAIYTNDSFNWSLPSDGSLQLEFASGDVANYRLIFATTDGTGEGNDFVVVDYVSGSNVAFGGSVIFSKSPEFSWILSEVPGRYLTQSSLFDDSDQLVDQDVIYHLYPDNTGVVEIENVDPVSGLSTTTFSSNKICWGLDADGFLVRQRIRNPGGAASGRGELPLPSRCASFEQSEVAFSRQVDLFDRLGDGVTIQTVLLNSENPCGFVDGPDPACEPLELVNSFLAQYNFSPYSAVPPIPRDSQETTTFDMMLSVDVLANVLPGDLSVDPSSLVVTNGPFAVDGMSVIGQDGTATVDAANQIIFTPDALNDQDRDVLIEFKVSDVAGNQSIPGLLRVGVVSNIVPPPSFFASPASLNDLHTVGTDPCSDPIGTLSVGSSNGGDISVTGISIVGAINGFIDAVAQTPGGQAPNQLVDVSFNCASADDAIRNGDIVIDTVDIATGFTSSVTVPITHEVMNPPAPVAISTPATIGGVHTVGSSPCPDTLGTLQISSSDGSDIQVTGVSVAGAINGFITANLAAGGNAPSLPVNVQFNCASAAGATRTGDITVDTLNVNTGTTSSVVVPVTHTVSGSS